MYDKIRTIYANLSDQAKMAVWIYGFTWMVVNFMIMAMAENSTVISRLLVWNLSILLFIFNIYMVDCTVKGNCNFLAYYLVGITLAQCILMMYPLVSGEARGGSLPQPKEYPF